MWRPANQFLSPFERNVGFISSVYCVINTNLVLFALFNPTNIPPTGMYALSPYLTDHLPPLSCFTPPHNPQRINLPTQRKSRARRAQRGHHALGSWTERLGMDGDKYAARGCG
jgi:hypothetical protein